MGTRYLNTSSSDGNYTTDGQGSWYEFSVDSGGESFGGAKPYRINLSFSNVRAPYKGSVTVDFSLVFAFSNDRWNPYTVKSYSRTMNRNSSNFDGIVDLYDNPELVTRLQNYSITHIGIRQDGNRKIKGYSSSYCDCSIEYLDAPPPPPPTRIIPPDPPTVSQNIDGTYTLRWNKASIEGTTIPGEIIKYRVMSAEGGALSNWAADTYSFTGNGYEYLYTNGYQWQIEVSYGSYTESSGFCPIFKFNQPVLSIPSISIDKTTGLTCTISWTTATLSYTTGDIYYDVYVADKYITSVSNGNLYYAFSRQQCHDMAPNSKIHIVVVAKNLSNSTSPAGSRLYATTSPVYFTYDFDVNLGVPKNITIIQNNNGTFTISWEQSPMENGSREYIYYQVISLSDGSSLSSWIKDLNFTAKITDYDFNIEYQISAKYDDGIDMLEVSSDPVSARFILPSIAAPYLMIDKESGNEVTLTWQPAVLMHTDGDVFYDILKNNSSIKTAQETSNYFGEMELYDWGKDPVTLKIKAHGTNLTNTDAGDLFVDSNEVTFTFIPSAPSGSKIAYFDGANWIPAQIYWYDGQNWILCMMSYHNGTDWQICSI